MSRLIDADALKRKAQRVATEFWKMGLTARIETTLNQFIDWIDNAPTVQQEPHWIPCSERLPNHDEYIKNNGLFIVSDGNRSYSEWYDIYDKRRFGEPTMSGFRIDYAVTAWMPMPIPPYCEV